MSWENDYMKMFALLAAAAAFVLPSAASATILVDRAVDGLGSVGGSSWGGFTAALGTQPGGWTYGSVGDVAAIRGASAIIVNVRENISVLSGIEAQNLHDFAVSGGRILLIGGHSGWKTWNDSIVGMASNGTATTSPYLWTTRTSAWRDRPATQKLVAGVNILTPGNAALVRDNNAGISLFTMNLATLWGPSNNVLTLLGTQTLDGRNAQFNTNVANWLGRSTVAAVPEPASWAMMLVGFGSIGFAMRRRKSSGKVAISFVRKVSFNVEALPD